MSAFKMNKDDTLAIHLTVKDHGVCVSGWWVTNGKHVRYELDPYVDKRFPYEEPTTAEELTSLGQEEYDYYLNSLLPDWMFVIEQVVAEGMLYHPDAPYLFKGKKK